MQKQTTVWRELMLARFGKHPLGELAVAADVYPNFGTVLLVKEVNPGASAPAL